MNEYEIVLESMNSAYDFIAEEGFFGKMKDKIRNRLDNKNSEDYSNRKSNAMPIPIEFIKEVEPALKKAGKKALKDPVIISKLKKELVQCNKDYGESFTMKDYDFSFKWDNAFNQNDKEIAFIVSECPQELSIGSLEVIKYILNEIKPITNKYPSIHIDTGDGDEGLIEFRTY